jgi:hypothetical protein
MESLNISGIIRPKSEYRFKINHFNTPIDFSQPIEDQVTEQSHIVTLQTNKCLYSKYFKAVRGGSLLIVLEDDIDNKVLDYVNSEFNGYNDFLIQLLDGDMKTLSNVYAKDCDLSSMSSEVDYGGKGAHQFLVYFDAAQIRYFK